MDSPVAEPETPTRLKMYVDGAWTESASGEHFESYDPFTAKPWALVPKGNAEDVDRAVQAAHRAFTEGDWARLHPTSVVRFSERSGT